MKQPDRAKFIVVDGWKHANQPLADFHKPGYIPGEVVIPDRNEDGYYIFECPLSMVQHYITVQEYRFKLFMSPPVMAVKHNPDLTQEYRTYNPWSYREHTKNVPDPDDPRKVIPKITHEWFEVTDAHDHLLAPEHLRAKGKTEIPDDKFRGIGAKPDVAPEAEPMPTVTQDAAPPAADPTPEPPPQPGAKPPATKGMIVSLARTKAVALVGEEIAAAKCKEYCKRVGKKNVVVLSIKQCHELKDELLQLATPVTG